MKALTSLNVAVLWAGVAAAAFGADTVTTISEPVLGLVSAAGATDVRAVVGVPSSASLGAPLSLPLDTQEIAVDSPELAGVLKDANGWSVFRLGASMEDPVTLARIDGLQAAETGGTFVFSPSGGVAVYFSAGQVQVVDVQSANPSVTWTTATEIQQASALGISDDGTMVAVGDASRVYLLRAKTAPLLVQITQGAPGVAFLADADDLAVVDAGTGAITLHENLTGSASRRVIASESSFSGEKTFIESGAGGADLFLASAGQTVAFRVGVTDGAVQSVALPAPVTRLDRLGAGDLFVVSYEENQPAWMVWSDGETLEAIFAATTQLKLRDSRSRR